MSMQIVEPRYRVKDLVNYPERSAKEFVDKKGRYRKATHKPASKGLLNIAECTLWKWVKAGKFPKPTYLTGATPTWTAGEINTWLEQRKQAGSG